MPHAAAAAQAAQAASGAPQPRPEPVPNDALQRVLAHARDSLAREHQLGALDEPLDASPLLRLMDDPLPLAAPPRNPRALDNDTATRLMERLFTHLQQQAGLSEHSRALLSGLQGPGQALAASEPTLWQSLDHPWWKLMDRLIGVAAVPGADTPDGADTAHPVTQALGEVVVRMDAAPPPTARPGKPPATRCRPPPSARSATASRRWRPSCATRSCSSCAAHRCAQGCATAARARRCTSARWSWTT